MPKSLLALAQALSEPTTNISIDALQGASGGVEGSTVAIDYWDVVPDSISGNTTPGATEEETYTVQYGKLGSLSAILKNNASFYAWGSTNPGAIDVFDDSTAGQCVYAITGTGEADITCTYDDGFNTTVELVLTVNVS